MPQEASGASIDVMWMFSFKLTDGLTVRITPYALSLHNGMAIAHTWLSYFWVKQYSCRGVVSQCVPFWYILVATHSLGIGLRVQAVCVPAIWHGSGVHWKASSILAYSLGFLSH